MRGGFAVAARQSRDQTASQRDVDPEAAAKRSRNRTHPLHSECRRGPGRGGASLPRFHAELIICPHMNRTAAARRLRREQTDEEKELWRALKAGRFAGFK